MRILLIDPHALFRHGMRQLLAGLERPLELIEADHVGKARDAAPQPVDLVLTALSYPDLSPLDALDVALKSFPEAAVVVVSGRDDPTLVFEALERGAQGFIPKSSTSSVLISALRLILVGGLYLPRHVLDYRHVADVPAAGRPAAPAVANDAPNGTQKAAPPAAGPKTSIVSSNR
ncbi:MAG: response regulator transcription factor [Burkholderiaceae bacterium]